MFHNNLKSNISLTMAASVFLSAFLLSSCSPNEAAEHPSEKQMIQADAYTTTAIRSMQPEYELSLPGELKPYEQVAIYAKVSGFVKKLYVDRGSTVHKGQLLAILEAPEIEQQYLSDKSAEQKLYSNYVYAQQAYQRLTEASATNGAVAALELDRAKSAMESTQAAYKSSKASATGAAQLRNYLRITAPFDGVITERNVSAGALTGSNSGQPLFFLAKKNKLRLSLALPEKHAGSVHEGMTATFTVSSQPGKVFNATLSRTSGLLDRTDRSLTLEFDVNNVEGALQGDDYALVRLLLQRNAPTFWVPEKSILNTQSGNFVVTLNKGIVKRIPVKEGIGSDSLREIFGALSTKDSILLKPSEQIKEGKINL